MQPAQASEQLTLPRVGRQEYVSTSATFSGIVLCRLVVDQVDKAALAATKQASCTLTLCSSCCEPPSEAPSRGSKATTGAG